MLLPRRRRRPPGQLPLNLSRSLHATAPEQTLDRVPGERVADPGNHCCHRRSSLARAVGVYKIAGFAGLKLRRAQPIKRAWARSIGVSCSAMGLWRAPRCCPMSDARTPQSDIITAAVLVIGDEILSGRTKDKNIGFIAEYLTNIGIDLREVRVVADVEDEIVAALDALRHRYTYVFTTGGIGPTHDDITADCVAKAFGVTIDVDPRAKALLLTRIAEKDLNEARLRMDGIAAVPQGRLPGTKSG